MHSPRTWLIVVVLRPPPSAKPRGTGPWMEEMISQSQPPGSMPIPCDLSRCEPVDRVQPLDREGIYSPTDLRLLEVPEWRGAQ